MIDSFLQYIQYRKNYSSCTVLSYHNDLSQFQSFLQSTYRLSLTQAESYHIRDWMIHLKEHKQHSNSINRKISSLKSFYKYLLLEHKIDKNPTDTIFSLKRAQKLPVFFREDDIDDVINDAHKDADSFEAYRKVTILEILYQTGMRRAELLNLKDSNFNFFSLTLRVSGKGNKERVIPISSTLADTIQQYINKKEHLFGKTDTFIVTDKGEAAYPNFIYRIVKESMSAVSTQDKRSPHVMRHSFASSLLNNGADINAVKELLGHANLSATQVYTHTSFEQLKESYKRAHPRQQINKFNH